ncbi:MAG: TAT-variant-translocated molybdopterin oxidoreductase [Planctomycetota bacterium]
MNSKQLPIVEAGNGAPGAQAASESAGSPRIGYWRSVGQLDGSADYQEFAQREFPQAASEFPEGVSRRGWLKLMGASLSLAGAAGCRYGPNEIASLVVRPEDTIPGVAKKYASNFELAGRAVHLMVTNMDGRPIKVDGNPRHPIFTKTELNEKAKTDGRFATAGTDVYSQACVLGLYDPDRTQSVYSRVDGELEGSSWGDFQTYVAGRLGELSSASGQGLAVVVSPSLSPSLNRLLKGVLADLPEATLVTHSSVDSTPQAKACAKVAGQPAELLYDLSDAAVVCCLDVDLIGSVHNSVLYSRQFAKLRDPKPGKMNRLYSVEATYTVTGAGADSRLPLRSSDVGAFLVKLEQRVDELLAGGQPIEGGSDEKAFDEVDAAEQLSRFVEAMAADLVAHKGHGVVAVGGHQPFDVQMASLRLNKKLGNTGVTVNLMPSRSDLGVESVGLSELVGALESGDLTDVWVLGDNPVYSCPGGLPLGDLLGGLDDVVYFAEFVDETANVASWVLPLAHPLECWGDVRGCDGTYGVGQPQILPLLGGKSAVEILSLISGQEVSGEEVVRETAKGLLGGALSSRGWREILHEGFAGNTEFKPLAWGDVEAPMPIGSLNPGQIETDDLEIVFAASDALYDGRFAKNVWLQEAPDPMTKIVWDNAAIVGPRTAEKLGLKLTTGPKGITETVKLSFEGRSIELPVFIMPGQAPGSITVNLGYGRVCRDEAVDSNEQVAVGVNVSPLRPSDNAHFVSGVKALGTSRPFKLATTQDHFAIDNGLLDMKTGDGLDITRERAAILIREGTLEQIDEGGADYVEHLGTHHPELESLWEEPIEVFENDPTVPNQWAMAVDLNKCTGCNACVIACQAENNIPVVGKEQVSRGREMHWMRIDRYFRGDVDTPKIVNQPVSCMHCETAPCEQVCPVAATVHTEDGINAMAYNRCIGTRYCANNCPYKVRRFNYFNYNTEYGYFYGWQQRGKLEEASRKLQQLVLNPEVTVRGRGVMEKCTYCIQRIQQVKIATRAEGRPIEDGDIQSACQEACSTQAIVFGDKKDPNSMVSKAQNDPRAYAMLAELNVKPRTMFLARVRNTHPRLMTVDQRQDASHGHGGHGEGGHGEGSHGEGSHGEGSHGDGDHSAESHEGENHAAEAH